jgi:hypothetical protein
MEVVGFMFAPVQEEQTETKFIARVNEEDPFYIEIDQVNRRIVVRLAASPIRTNFLRRWIVIVTEIAKLNIERDAPIDLVYDYTQAKPVEPSLKVIMFTKALGAGKLFLNVQTWRVVPGDPTKHGFLREFSREMSSSWLPLRVNEKVFRSVEQAETYLDELRAQIPKEIVGDIGRRLTQARKDRSNLDLLVWKRVKTESAKWKDRTIQFLTDAQARIRHLYKAYLKGEITLDEFKKGLPTILNKRDRGKHTMNS